MAELKTIRNIGDKMQAMLISVGIETAEELREIGAFEAQVRLLQAGLANHRFYYQPMKLGLQDRKWNEIDKDEKIIILAEFKAIQDKAKANFQVTANSKIPALLEKSLKEIGVI